MRWLAAISMLASGLYGQSVEGVVTNTVTHAPQPGIKVSICCAGSYSAVTDAAGAFRFPDVLRGQYVLSYEGDGFLPPNPSARQLFTVSDTTVRFALDIVPMPRIDGRVVFADGSPAPRAEVLLLVARGYGATTTRADADGRFQLRNLPGRFVLLAMPPRGAKAEPGMAWAPTYFPNAYERSAAQPISFRGGADLSGFEIRLRQLPVFHIRGVVRDNAGRAVSGAKLKLVAPDWLSLGSQDSTSGPEGVFDFATTPGDWRLVAGLTQGDIELKAVRETPVGRRDLENLEIRLARPFTLRGFVDREEPRDRNGKRQVSGVSLSPVREDSPGVVFHEQDGSFEMKNVYPGRYEIQPVGFKPGYYLESVKLGDREVIGQMVELFEGSPPIRITYKPDAPRVRVQVEKGPGAIVALVPQDEAFMTGQFIRQALAANDGSCEIGSLRPGDYYAFAFDRVDRSALEDPQFVRGLVSSAEKIHIEKGDFPTVQLRVTAWPE